jgi:soluble lytic murein transglycosylase-like protein
MLNIKLAVALCLALAEPDRSMSQEKLELACYHATTIVQKSLETSLNPATAAALITVESSWRPHVVSSAGACGLTQVVPKWTGRMTGGRQYTCDELKNPEDSIRAGIAALGYWRKRYRRNTRLALCGYNAGNSCRESSTRQHAGIRYSEKVQGISRSISSSMCFYTRLMDLPRLILVRFLGLSSESSPRGASEVCGKI